jgi:predicted AAA+ superfamily ATPase
MLNIKKGLIITMDEEDEIMMGDREIKIVKAWKWMAAIDK